jgi:hypothetical protein
MEDHSRLTAQLVDLRRDIFWTRCILAVLAVCLGVAVYAMWTRHPSTIEANEFVVRDRAGNIVARLGAIGLGETCLELTAKGDTSIANLCVQNEGGAILDLHNLKSESRATLTPGTHGSEGIGLAPLLSISSTAGDPSIRLTGTTGNQVWPTRQCYRRVSRGH